jgi:hypothetical protein
MQTDLLNDMNQQFKEFEFMTLNPNNDVYQGDLSTLNVRKQAWSKGDVTSQKYRSAAWVVLAVGFCVIIYVMLRVSGGTTKLSQLPLHLSIWITALLGILVSRQGKKISEQPFSGFHMARFEVDDDTVYYVYQQGMSRRTYYIHDKDIRRISRDDEAGVLLIEGDATINIKTRKNETEEKVSEFYALVPFDKYDLDDLLQPFKKKVRNVNGQLREKFTAEHIRKA